MYRETLLEQSDRDRMRIDFSDICGQRTLKRGLEITVAGIHTMLIVRRGQESLWRQDGCQRFFEDDMGRMS